MVWSHSPLCAELGKTSDAARQELARNFMIGVVALLRNGGH
jgi:hypothetical protein